MNPGRPDFTLCLITDRLSLPPGRDLLQTIEQALIGGVGAVQLREKDLSAAELFELALPLRALTRRHGATLLINDRIDVALAVEADGVHLGHGSLPATGARVLLGPQKLIGISTHQLDQIPLAARDGADFITFSPVYFTPSKAPYGAPQGIERLQSACRASAIPVFALGGIRLEHLDEVRAAGAHGIALISAIFAADDPATAACTLVNALNMRGFPASRSSL
jgi:thiamine-phosphate pyrophosphorylase